MSCGVIPILTDIPSFVTLTNNGKAGALYTPGNDQILLLTQIDKPLARERKRVLSHFSFEFIASEVIQVYEKLIKDSKK